MDALRDEEMVPAAHAACDPGDIEIIGAANPDPARVGPPRDRCASPGCDFSRVPPGMYCLGCESQMWHPNKPEAPPAVTPAALDAEVSRTAVADLARRLFAAAFGAVALEVAKNDQPWPSSWLGALGAAWEAARQCEEFLARKGA